MYSCVMPVCIGLICCEHTQLPAVEEVGVYEMCIISNVIVIAVQSVRSTRVQLWEHDDSCQPVRSTEASGANRQSIKYLCRNNNRA